MSVYDPLGIIEIFKEFDYKSKVFIASLYAEGKENGKDFKEICKVRANRNTARTKRKQDSM